MVDIVFAILPVGEFSLVGALLLAGCVVLFDCACLLLGGFDLVGLVDYFVGGGHVHVVGVDDLVLLLHVERLLVLLHTGLPNLVVVLLLVIRYQVPRVRVLHKLIIAPGPPPDRPPTHCRI